MWTGGASCLGRRQHAQGVGRGDRRMRGDAGRALESVRCGVHCTFVMIWLRRRSSSVAVFPDGRRVVSASWDNTLKVWDVATGKCVATLEGHSSPVRCGVHCTFVMIWLRRRSAALPSLRTGGASCLVSERQHAQGVGRGDRRMRGDAGRALGSSAWVHCTFVMIWLRRRSRALPCFRTGGASCLRRATRTLKDWDVATGECRGDAGRALGSVRCGVRCTFCDDLASS